MSAPKDASFSAIAAPMPRLEPVTVWMFRHTFCDATGEKAELTNGNFAKEWLILTHCDDWFSSDFQGLCVLGVQNDHVADSLQSSLPRRTYFIFCICLCAYSIGIYRFVILNNAKRAREGESRFSLQGGIHLSHLRHSSAPSTVIYKFLPVFS